MIPSLLLIAAMVVGGIAALVLLVWLLWHGGRLIVAIITRIAEFVVGICGDVIRFIGATIASIVLVPIALISVLIGRWSAANHYSRAFASEVKTAAACVYRVGVRRPLRLLFLDGLLEGVEQRVPAAVAAAPAGEPSRRTRAMFPGYEIVGTLPSGGSGAKLYIARPDADTRMRIPGIAEQVVIKSFAIEDGSSLPQIVRESRALEGAKRMGLVFEHDLDDRRFHYVMPYHAGDNLGAVVRQVHGGNGGRGLAEHGLRRMLSYADDLVSTLAAFHANDLWHKDVKPENVIVHDGRAHLVDLGLVSSLRSAMTLTTHGTEYFRDPEMVRMALRGVKVHEVDGARFDVYGAGAVLYYALENTFPAHGGLSVFNRPSPEAVRWIVRRAMADYKKRYTSAEAMLADLRHVREAADPWQVRPVELPSMSGDPSNAPSAIPTPPPSAVAGAASMAGAAAARAEAPVGAGSGRVDLRVTNWWTGAYSPGSSETNGGARTGAFVAAAGAVAGSASQSARARARQVRENARELRRSMAASRRGTPRPSNAKPIRMRRPDSPNGLLLALGFAVILAIAATVGISIIGVSMADRAQTHRAAVMEHAEAAVRRAEATIDEAGIRLAADGTTIGESLEVSTLVDHSDRDDSPRLLAPIDPALGDDMLVVNLHQLGEIGEVGAFVNVWRDRLERSGWDVVDDADAAAVVAVEMRGLELAADDLLPTDVLAILETRGYRGLTIFDWHRGGDYDDVTARVFDLKGTMRADR